MKSRKSGLFGRRNKKRRAAASSPSSTLRKGLVESLEKRELLAADWSPTAAITTGLFASAEGMQRTIDYIEQRAAGSSGSGSGGSVTPEGGANDIVGIAEVENNNGIGQAQHVPLDGNFGVNISGSISGPLDEDWYSFDLDAGDTLDARLSGGAVSLASLPLMSLYRADNRELVSTTVNPGPLPAASPLTGSPTATTAQGDIALHYTVGTAGRYFIRVSDVLAGYNLSLRQYRPQFESQAAGSKQILFLDFDGGVVSRSLFGLGPGSARFSPLSTYLPQYGLQASDESAFIDEIVRRVQSKFDVLAQNTTNPNFGIEIRNSKDHADPFGQPNVSRIVVGGTWQELVGDPAATNDQGILGIAESVDFGNYNTEESAIVMQDILLGSFAALPVSAAATQMEAIAELMTFVITHEGGHFLGGWHQDPNNTALSLMDQIYDPFLSSGASTDGIFGTADDVPAQFATDAYAFGGGPFEFGGINDVVNAIGYGLSTGQQGGRISGRVYQDNNLSRSFDGGDGVIPGTRVYTDLNGNGVFETNEYNAVANSAGEYQFVVPPGSYTVREVVPAGFRLVNPVDNQIALTVGLNQTASGIDFGQERLNQNFTGMKWNDTNANGLRDDGEVGIEGVWIYIDLDGDNRIDIGEPATQTDPVGNYRLVFPGPGTYSIREVVDPGYVQTFPGDAAGNEHTVVLTGDPAGDADRGAGLNFGNTLTVDFGDAASSYGVASHGFLPSLRLGANWDAEQASQHSTDANGDDTNGSVDDEDGVSLVRPLAPGSNQVAVVANNTTGANAYLNAWVDFNQNGTFESGERVISDSIVGTGTTNVDFTAPAGAVLGNTAARFRYSAEQGLAATGASGTGEVEDYIFQVVADRQFTVDDTASVSRNSVLNEIDVLANDFKLPGETLTLLSNSSSSAGGTIALGTDNIIRYTPPSGFIGSDSFTYTARNSFGDLGTATVSVNVQLSFDNPVAVDDSFDLPTNAIDFPLNVLANDIEGQNGALSIVSITQPGAGQVSIATGGKSLRYTPARGFADTESFTYVAADANGNQSTATVTLHTLPGDRADDDVSIRLVARDTGGNLITAIPQGERFVIDVLVDDLRGATDQGASAGVFAAYADILYNLQLVSTVAAQPGDRLNFDAQFFQGYTNGTRGDASVPGVIDDFGAFFSETGNMNRPDEQLFARIPFDARSPGVARFMPDPADTSPSTDTLLFNVPSNAVPIRNISFLGTSIEIVGDGALFPVAVDDSLATDVPKGAIAFPVDVLANDRAGSTGSISISNVQDTSNQGGTVRLNGAGSGVLYTPRSDFDGMDQFTYTIRDTRGIESTATVTLRVGNANANDIVDLQLQVTDTLGNPIDQITVGSTFEVRGFVQDLRTTGADLGVFAAYEDVLYSSGLVSPVADVNNSLGFSVDFGPNYNRVREGSAVLPGLINELGAVSTGDTPLGNGKQLLFKITMTANALGTAQFISDPADIAPLHDTLTYEPVTSIPADQIRFGHDSLVIVAGGSGGNGEGFHNLSNALDVNNDGAVSPIDALSVINRLNRGEAGQLGSGEAGSGTPMFIDTNDDGHLSPVDALLVINFLNSSGSGEGEALDLLSYFVAPNVESAPGVLAEGESVLSAEPAELTGQIGSRLTGNSYGPSPSAEFPVDALIDLSDIVDEDDDLLGQLAEDVNGWNDRLI